MKRLFLFLAAIVFALTTQAQGYVIGDYVDDFTLKNIDDKQVSLSDYSGKKGVIVIFTCNHCPYAKAYEDRIIEIDKEFKQKEFPVIAINPNDPTVYSEDSFDNMKIRAKEKGFTFPYLVDEKQEVFPKFGATKTPHVFLLNNIDSKFRVEYIGAIDDNTKDANAVKNAYLKNAIHAVMNGEKPDPTTTKAIGCSIKVKK